MIVMVPLSNEYCPKLCSGTHCSSVSSPTRNTEALSGDGVCVCGGKDEEDSSGREECKKAGTLFRGHWQGRLHCGARACACVLQSWGM